LQLKPCEFWELTYAEFVLMINGYQRRNRDHINKLLFLAWHIEAFARQKKLPALDSILTKENGTQQRKEQSPEEMIAVCKMINAVLGGEEIAT